MFEATPHFGVSRRREGDRTDSPSPHLAPDAPVPAPAQPTGYRGPERRSVDRGAALVGRGEDLCHALKHLFTELEASAGTVMLYGAAADAPALLFSIGAEASPSIDRGRGARPARRSRKMQIGSMPVSWTDSDRDSSSWMRLEIPAGADRHGHFLVSALFRDATDDVRHLATERAVGLLPLLATVLRGWLATRHCRQQVQGHVAAMNHHDVGIVLLNGDGAILFANTLATALLDSGEHLRRSARSLRAVDLSSSRRLQVAIDHVGADANSGAAAVVPLTRPGQHRPLLITVLPSGKRPDDLQDTAVILFIVDPELDIGRLLEPICAFYKLTRVETLLACSLAQGQDIEAAAATLHVKEQTARTYLKQIFMKTDVRRQSDLVRLLLTSNVRAACNSAPELV